MGGWNGTVVRERFRKRADELARRLPTVKDRAAEMQSFRVMHDELLAKLSVYRSLLDQGPLETAADLSAALTRLKNTPPPASDALDPAIFAKHCREFVAALAGQYESSAPGR